jgi:glycosyltransferase involved in cell wall biosynthesis
MPSHSIVLICSGLGRIHRGFEIYISSLGEKLTGAQIWCGGKHQSQKSKVHTIPCIGRSSFFSKIFLCNSLLAFKIEQLTFAIALLPKLFQAKNSILYLGEYSLYCYLYKIRHIFSLNYSLVLYTGGQAIPGLFDPTRDFVHHVTDVYLKDCKHLPSNRQFLVPHFIDQNFSENEMITDRITKKSAGKLIVLSVGYLDCHIKRMDFLAKSLIPLKDKLFPIFLGESSIDTPIIEQILKDNFGKDGYILSKVAHSELASWYLNSDIFVLCSLRESFGLTMVEALYFGLPVFCNDYSEARFVLQDCGNFLNMTSMDILTKAVELYNPSANRSELKKDRKEFVEKNYSWSSLEKQYTQMFEKIISLQTHASLSPASK